MSTSMRFWDRAAKKYATQAITDMKAYEEKLSLTQHHFQPDFEVLEFGCGTGGTARIHAAHVKHILAVDYSQKMIDIARQRQEKEGVENVTFQAATIFDLPHQDASFDAILGMSVIHLLEDVDTTIQRVYDLLKPGSVFVSSTACLKEMSFIFRLILPVGKLLGLAPGVAFFSAAELEQKLVRIGFEIETHTQPGAHYTSFIIARKPK